MGRKKVGIVMEQPYRCWGCCKFFFAATDWSESHCIACGRIIGVRSNTQDERYGDPPPEWCPLKEFKAGICIDNETGDEYLAYFLPGVKVESEET